MARRRVVREEQQETREIAGDPVPAPAESSAKPTAEARTGALFSDDPKIPRDRTGVVDDPRVPRVLLCPWCKARSVTKACKALPGAGYACLGCGQALSAMNGAPALTTDRDPPELTEPSPKASPAAKLSPKDPIAEPTATGSRGPVEGPRGATVTVVWGKELFSPKQFHTYEVGPFSSTQEVRPGESIAQAEARISKELTAFAESERKKKRDSYLAAMKEMFEIVKSAAGA